MIELKRSMTDKWIFQKNISSTELIKSYLSVINITKDIDKEMIISKLKNISAYKGRSEEGSLSTMGVRFSQMCFYMFGYKNNNNKFIPSTTTLNLLTESKSVSKNMLVNLFSIQYPHPYSDTPDDIQIFAGRLILKLLTDSEIDTKLYIDEMIYFLPFIKTIDKTKYQELIQSILEYRKLTYEEKLALFKKEYNWQSLFANCVHEFSYYFARIFQSFEVLEIIEDQNHNYGKLFKFLHGTSTIRNDAYKSRGKYSGFIKVKEDLVDDVNKLLSKYSPFDKPETMKDVYSKTDLVHDLYETQILDYLSTISTDYSKEKEIMDIISEMQRTSKYGSVDGKDFENYLKPVFELFRENLNVEIISGAGNTDLLCVFEDTQNNNPDYKIDVEAKSRNSANSMNPVRIERHTQKNGSDYCIIVAPRFSRGNDADISNMNMVSITAETLGQYCSKECLSSKDGKADFNIINNLIRNNLGTNITRAVDIIIEEKYGF